MERFHLNALDPDRVAVAVDAAGEAVRAGWDEHDQLRAGIAAYMLGGVDLSDRITLPGEIGVALLTERPEVAGLIRARLRTGDALTADEVEGIVRLAEQAVALRAELFDRAREIDRYLGQVGGLIRGLDGKVATLRSDLSDLLTGRPNDTLTNVE